MDFVTSHIGKMNTSDQLNTFFNIFIIKIRFSSNQNIGEGESNFDDKYAQKSVQLRFNWSEFHLSEMTCYKIHALTANIFESGPMPTP